LLERNIKRILEENNAQEPIKQARNDYLIVKKGICRVLFRQEILEVEEEIKTPIIDEASGEQTGENIVKNVTEELGEKKIEIEYFSWKDVAFQATDKWEQVEWVGFRHYMTQEEMKEKFGQRANLVKFICEDEDKNGLFKKAEVWEIWDKKKKKVYFYCEGYDKGLLKEIDDNYNLINFYNMPRPLGIDSGVDSVNDLITDYENYEQQAKELDRISARILAIIPYISVGGAYNAALKQDDVQKFLEGIEAYAPLDIPLDSDIQKMIYERDIAKLTVVLQTLFTQRQETIRAIQEITGISDVVRGQTQATETATAQELKGNFAISRINPAQQEMEFFCRDIVRIIAELLAEKFDVLEMAQAAQIKVFDMDALTEKFTAELEQQGVPQEQFMAALTEKLRPYQKEIKSGQATTINNLLAAAKILKSDKLRGWAIEVETDSTIKVDQNAEKEAVMNFANAISTVSQQFLPLVQAGVFSKDAFKSLLSYIMRRFEGSEEVEELLDDEETEDTNQAEAMQQQALQQEMQTEERELGIKEFQAQSKAEYDNKKLQLDENKALLEADLFSDEMKQRQEELNNKVADQD